MRIARIDGVGNASLRVCGVRKAYPDLRIMTDADTGYSVADARAMLPVLDECGVEWLGEPFRPHDHRAYRTASGFGHTRLAAGENLHTRFEFVRVIEDGAIGILQPDLSKTGGITEALRIAAMASAYKLAVNPHTSATGMDMWASVHFVSAIDTGGYYEADVAKENLFRDELAGPAVRIDVSGCASSGDAPGLGAEVNEAVLRAHPAIEGPA